MAPLCYATKFEERDQILPSGNHVSQDKNSLSIILSWEKGQKLAPNGRPTVNAHSVQQQMQRVEIKKFTSRLGEFERPLPSCRAFRGHKYLFAFLQPSSNCH